MLARACRLPENPACEHDGAHRRRHADARRLHVRLDELHVVQPDRQARVDDAAGLLMYIVMSLSGVLGGQVQELRDDQVRDLVVDAGAEEDDPLI